MMNHLVHQNRLICLRRFSPIICKKDGLQVVVVKGDDPPLVSRYYWPFAIARAYATLRKCLILGSHCCQFGTRRENYRRTIFDRRQLKVGR